MAQLETLAIIPARGGSKGLPRKNILDLGGKPVIAWTIEAATACPGIGRVIVSTDDPEIAEVARAYGAEVPFLRPDYLATDTATPGEVFGHVLESLNWEGYVPDIYMAMYPTSPFRSAHMVSTLLDKVQQGYRRAVTVRPISVSELSLLQIDPDGRLCSHHPQGHQRGTPTTLYRRYGLVEAQILKSTVCAYSHFVYEVRDPVQLLDIDSYDDLCLARDIVTTGAYPDAA